VLHVVGARPNFMKTAPIMAAMAAAGDIDQVLVHTGQHYDRRMSQVFFEDLGLPEPNVNLGVGSASHARQTAEVMLRFEPVLDDVRPDWVFVVGDVNSTLACALVCAKSGVRVAHVEAGLRSFDWSMPEEINRVLTDRASDLLLTPSSDGDENLLREGIAQERIFRVGNVMIDTLMRLLPRAQDRWPLLRERLGVDRFALVTLHRPSNVDDPRALAAIAAALTEIANDLPVIFPVHPRTSERIRSILGSGSRVEGVRLLEPQPYLDFLALEAHAAVVLTDSGGVQEETTVLGVPCLTLRDNTERPITVTNGTNRVIGSRRADITRAVRESLGSSSTPPTSPELWDGRAATRVVQALRSVR
jgi:UDP-N-acetylglucosamine 2-epimerase (non-hydrolysing)